MNKETAIDSGLFPEAVIGHFYRFGETGQVYEVLGIEKPLENGDYLMKIVLPLTKEEARVKLSDILSDPEEGKVKH
jgi:hypothetical protein